MPSKVVWLVGTCASPAALVDAPVVYTQIDAHNSRLEFDIVDDLANPWP